MNSVLERQVLVVDDTELIRDLLIEFLSLNSCHTAWAGNGDEALRKLKAESFHVLVTDLYMPDMSGVELTRAVRALKIPLTVIGMSSAEKEETFLKAGADYFILKPFDFRNLKRILNTVFRR